jgi:hypothetical protein
MIYRWRTLDALQMPRCFDTLAVYEAWLGVLLAQYKSGHISYGRYVARCRQAREQWEYELRCAPERRERAYYGRHQQEQTV